MSAPIVQSTSPAPSTTDVVLGCNIEILFDQPVDPASISTATFSLQGPPQTDVVAADGAILSVVTQPTGREYILGSFGFPAPGVGDTFLQNQKLAFTPAAALRAGVTYTVLLVGATSQLAKSYIRNVGGEPMAHSYRFTFTTGSLNQTLSPPAAPLPVSVLNAWEKPTLDPSQIRIIPRKVTGNDLTQQILLVFPAPIDPASFNTSDLLVSLEPLLNDPSIEVGALAATVAISGNTITVTTGIPPDSYQSVGTSRTTPTSQFGSTFPTTGDWIAGDIVINSIPQPGGNMGWVCVAAGEPGVWEPYGIIGSS